MAHETGHIFYAFDEYPEGAHYTSRRGYYNTQNLNAFDGHPDPELRVPSIIAEPELREIAWQQIVSSPTSMEMLGWRDSDANGIFDVLDVPLVLSGSGLYDAAAGQYHFTGSSSVQTLPNLNPSSLGNDMTINRIRVAEYRLNGGPWMVVATFDDRVTTMNFSFPVVPENVIEIRTSPDLPGVVSNVFTDTILHDGLPQEAVWDGDFPIGIEGDAILWSNPTNWTVGTVHDLLPHDGPPGDNLLFRNVPNAGLVILSADRAANSLAFQDNYTLQGDNHVLMIYTGNVDIDVGVVANVNTNLVSNQSVRKKGGGMLVLGDHTTDFIVDEGTLLLLNTGSVTELSIATSATVVLNGAVLGDLENNGSLIVGGEVHSIIQSRTNAASNVNDAASAEVVILTGRVPLLTSSLRDGGTFSNVIQLPSNVGSNPDRPVPSEMGFNAAAVDTVFRGTRRKLVTSCPTELIWMSLS